MDLLRRIFGLQPSTGSQPSAIDLDGPTAPLPAYRNEAIRLEKASSPSASTQEAAPQEEEIGDGRTRKLPEYETVVNASPNGRRLTFGQHTDVGQIRTNNQDAIMSLLTTSNSSDEQPEFGVFVVADGMGGHHDGEKASALTTRVITHYVSNAILMPMLIKLEQDSERPTISEIIQKAVQYANERVSNEVPDGGTTATVAAIMGDLAYIGHVGDSRAYLIANDMIEQLTRDHSLVQRLIELEQLTPAEAAEHPQRNVLYRAIGQSDTIEVEATSRRLMPGSRLLICSDGLWNLVPEDEIKSTVLSSPSPQSASETLVKLANDRGGPDNISVILVRVPD